MNALIFNIGWPEGKAGYLKDHSSCGTHKLLHPLATLRHQYIEGGYEILAHVWEDFIFETESTRWKPFPELILL